MHICQDEIVAAVALLGSIPLAWVWLKAKLLQLKQKVRFKK